MSHLFYLSILGMNAMLIRILKAAPVLDQTGGDTEFTALTGKLVHMRVSFYSHT